MITPKDIEKKNMTPAKRAMAHNDLFTIAYFFINGGVMLLSLVSIFENK